jgi:L-ascorbate metabolism protein UlaG (beta-lactamase superfamily)
MIKENERVIYIDPYNMGENNEKADLVFITHSHYDHCSVGDLDKILKEGTRVVITADCQSKIARSQIPLKIEIAEPGKEFNFGSLRVFSLPAYNIDKPFHPKEESWVGYLLKFENVVIYHAGDTDVIPEMQKLTGHKKEGSKFVALLPIGGRFTMSGEEALEVVKTLKPDLTIPMHYGSIVGTKEDAEEFKRLCEEENFDCEVLNVKK